MNKTRRFLAAWLALLMVVSLLPVYGLAEENYDVHKDIILKLDFENTTEPSAGSIEGQYGTFEYTDGKNGKAAKFTEGNYIDLGEIDFTQSKTIGAWIQVARFNNVDDPVIFGNKSWYNTKNDGMILALVKPDQFKYNWGNTKTAERKDIKYDYDYNQWMYVTVVADRETNTMKFYVDGVLFQSVDFSAFDQNCLNGPNTFKLGNDGTGAYEKNDGRYEFLADDFTIFDKALTQSEIHTVIAGGSSLDAAWIALDEQKIKGNNTSLSEVTGDLILPKEIDGIPISWITYDAAVDQRSGIVTRGVQDTDVEMTAILDSGTAVREKNFKACVKGLDVPQAPAETIYESDMKYADRQAFLDDGFIFETSQEGVSPDDHSELIFEEDNVFLKRKTYGSSSAAEVRMKRNFILEESTDPYVVEFTIQQVNGSAVYLEGTSTSRGWQPLFTMGLEQDKLNINADDKYGKVNGVADKKVNVKIDIDGVNKKMSVYVNGNLEFKEVPFRNSAATMVQRLSFSSKSGSDSTKDGGIRFYNISLKKMKDSGFGALIQKADIHRATDENTNRITKNLNLVSDDQISWRSSDASVITQSGGVTRGAQDQTVTLYADITKDGLSMTIPYTVTVRNYNGTADKVFQVVDQREMPVREFYAGQRLRIESDGYGEDVSPVLALYQEGKLTKITAKQDEWMTIPEETAGYMVRAMLLNLETMKPEERHKQLAARNEEEKSNVKIGIFSDLHIDMIPRGYARLEYFMEQMQQQQADLIVSLGDFVNAEEKNKPVIDLFRSTEIPAVSVLGNHDLDTSSRDKQLSFTGEARSYYSKDIGNVHCIFLDTNFKSGNNYILPQEQLRWLKKDLSMTTKPCILFSHEELRFTVNSEEILKMMQSSGATVIAVVNGHNHVDGFNEFGPYHSIDINSMAGQWLGSGSTIQRLGTDYYTDQEYKDYTSLKYTAPYENPVFAVYTIDTQARTVQVAGQTSNFIWKTPKERGHWSNIYGIPYTASIEDREFSY